MLQCCRSQCIAGHVLLPKHKDAWLQPESRLNHICICWCRDNLQSVVSCKIINSPAFKFTNICQNNGESRQLLQVMTYLFVVLFTFRVRSCPVAQAGEACSSCSGIPNPDCTSKPAPGYCCKSEGFVFILSVATDKVYPFISVHLKGGRIDPRSVRAPFPCALCAHGAHHTCRKTLTHRIKIS